MKLGTQFLICPLVLTSEFKTEFYSPHSLAPNSASALNVYLLNVECRNPEGRAKNVPKIASDNIEAMHFFLW